MSLPLRISPEIAANTACLRATIVDRLEAQEHMTPSEQLALLQLRGSSLARAVAMKLKHSTVRAGEQELTRLRALQLAVLKAAGRHALTPRGRYLAEQITRTQARALGILPAATAAGSFQRRNDTWTTW